MKLLFLLVISQFAISANAQNQDSLRLKIEGVLKLKHAYEASLELEELKKEHNGSYRYNDSREVYIKSGAKENIGTSFSEYLSAINTVKQHKKLYQAFFEKLFNSKDSQILTERIVVYDYEFPLWSIRDKNNTISKLSFLKAFNHFMFELNRVVLPTLKEVTAFLEE